MTDTSAFPTDPWSLFAQWFALAEHHEPSYPNAMSLATLDEDGRPSVRIVLMKHFDADGIIFHTNLNSRKGRAVASHPQAALCFYWKSLMRQIRVEGDVMAVSETCSDAYFKTRPRASQMGAWASKQSQPLESREALNERVRFFEQKFEGQEVPRPPHWGGYRMKPSSFEFWQEIDYRLHDRIAYRRASDPNVWTRERLFP